MPVVEFLHVCGLCSLMFDPGMSLRMRLWLFCVTSCTGVDNTLRVCLPTTVRRLRPWCVVVARSRFVCKPVFVIVLVMFLCRTGFTFVFHHGSYKCGSRRTHSSGALSGRALATERRTGPAPRAMTTSASEMANQGAQWLQGMKDAAISMTSREKKDEDEAYSPYQSLQKSVVLQECRCFDDREINPRRCITILTKILWLLSQGTCSAHNSMRRARQ